MSCSFPAGIPKFANEDWVAMLFGFDKVKVFACFSVSPLRLLYRDGDGVPTGAAIVGLASVEEALRVQVRSRCISLYVSRLILTCSAARV